MRKGMRGSVVGHLIAKDLLLNWLPIVGTMAASVLALVILQRGGEVPFVLGSVWFFVPLAVLGSLLPVSTIVNERKKQHLAFLMSLPVSAIQYTTAKVVSTLLMFLAPWLTLSITALVLITSRNVVPRGAIPMFFVLALMPVVGFCLIFGTALVGESEGWGMAASIVCNSSYGVAWYLLSRMPSLTANWGGRVAVWNPALLRVLSAEIGVSVLFVGLTYLLQSRKREFV